jgi:hypothetical protein
MRADMCTDGAAAISKASVLLSKACVLICSSMRAHIQMEPLLSVKHACYSVKHAC